MQKVDVDMITRHQIDRMDHEKTRIRKATYTKIYETFSRKIRMAVDSGQRFIILHVPPFVMGQPSYELPHAGRYLYRQLKNAGFDVTVMDTQNLSVFYVSWQRKSDPEKEVPEYEPRHQEDLSLSELPDLPALINLKKLARHYGK